MKKAISMVLALTMTVLLAACGAPNDAETKAEGSTLVYGSGDYTRINPAMDEHGEINVLLFNGLTAHDGDNQVVPGLAESWDYDETTCTYTFHIRDGIRWHDGEPFTAKDVQFTIETIMDPDNGSENAPNYEDVEEITVVDDQTISFRLAAPKIDTVIFKIVADDNAQAMQLESGELDLALLDPKNAANFEGRDGFTCYDMTTADYRGILFNFANDYWTENRDLIPAVCCALDRQAIIDSVLLGQGMAAYSPLQRNRYNNEDVERYDYDPDRARQILEGAGCVQGDDGFYTRNGEPVGFTISVMAGEQDRIDIAQAAAQQLREVGIQCTVEIPAQMDWGGQMACLIGWGSPFDADDHTYKVFGTGKGANYSSYTNEKVDEYLTLARQSDDPGVRGEYYGKFQEELAKDPAYAFLCYIDANYVTNSNIQGIAADTVLGHHGVGIFWNIHQWTIG